MAELIVSAILPVLFEKLMSRELLNFATQEGVRSKLKEWEKTLNMIKALLNDAEKKQLDDEFVKLWLDDLQDLAYDAEDILDEYATEASRRKLKIEEHQASTSRARKLIPACCIGSTPSDLWSDFSMLSKIDDVTRRLEDLCKQKTELGLEKIQGGRSTTYSSERLTTTSSQTEPAVYGREDDKAKILKMVLNDEPGHANFGVISIVAMGGVGKTTLAREVYNDKAVKDFNPKAWVCVSDDFDVMRISLAILESITDGCASDLKNLDVVQKQIKEKVAGRKFLFVLDDVWSEDYSKWELLKSPFMVGDHGSKIIVTTRHEVVALTMGRSSECHRLMLLSNNDCWSLFEKHAFDNVVMGADPTELIRQKVIEKCKGLPLVAKTLAGLLRTKKIEQWLDILNSTLWQLLDGRVIPAALLISYHHLPPHLKRCFSYCAILPKDYEFEEKELVLLWMAEGLIQKSSDNEQLEDLGGRYFHDLLSRSIFQISSNTCSKYIMHDLVNDLAREVSRKRSFWLEDELESNNRSNISKMTRYASYIGHQKIDKRKFEVFSVAVHLRTYLSISNVFYTSHTVISDLLKFKELRVLSLKQYYIFELPDSIGGLRLLRYLNLSGSEIRSLPESVNTMCNLQTLILRDCYRLLKWPSKMESLINLRHFDIKGAFQIEEMPVGIRKWECLRTLSNFIVDKDSKSSLKDLKHLKFLSGKLHISRLENVIDFEDILSDKKNLKVLLLEWGFRDEEDEVDKKVLDMLRPHQNLEKLTIRRYGGTKFSSWVGSSSFSKCKMTVLKLIDCRKCTSLPSLGLLGSLKSLTIEGMSGVKSIGSEFFGEHCSNPFQSLETLYFGNLEEWECWDPIKENERFPKLQELSIVDCPRLSERLPSNLCSLKKLVIRRCEQLVVSLPNIPTLCELKLNECKKILCSNSADFESLESMTLSNISYFGDWSLQEFKKVKSLEIDGCEELIELWQNEIFLEKPPQGLHSLISLRKLRFKNCNTLTTLLEGIKQKNVQVEELRIEKCNSLNSTFRGKLPQSLKKLIIYNCEKLQCLLDNNEDTCSSSSSKFIILPEENAVNSYTSHLEDLYIKRCPALTCLLSTDLLSITLTRLQISDCSNLTTLSSTGQLPVLLKHLEIDGCSELTALLPKGQLPETLETLRIYECEQLEWIVEKFHNNKALCEIRIWRCDNFKSFPEGLHTLSSLRSIEIGYCNDFASFPKGGFPNSNFTLYILRCEKLEALPNEINTLSSLQIQNCPNMSLSEEGLFTKLESLSITSVKQYKALIQLGLHNFTSLTFLYISGNLDIESLQEEDMKITLPRSLTSLRIGEFTKLKYLSFKGLEDLPSLGSLEIEDCAELISLPSLPSSLSKLQIYNCPLLKELTPFSSLPSSLSKLEIRDCPLLKELTSLPSLPSSLFELEISNCPLLKKACKRDKGKEWLKIADIPYVQIDHKFIYDPEEESEA